MITSNTGVLYVGDGAPVNVDNQETPPQQLFGFRPGYADKTTMKIMVCSLSRSDLNVTFNGVTQTVTFSGLNPWDRIGDLNTLPITHPKYNPAPGVDWLGYVANLTFTQANTPLTRYPLTVTQSGTTYDGSTFIISDTRTDDFSFYTATCDNNTIFGGQGKGYYQYIRNYFNTGALPIAGIVTADDIYGYVDLDEVDDSAGTGHVNSDIGVTNPRNTDLEYDYAMGYFAAFGLFQDSSNPYVDWGQEKDRVWAMRNINMWGHVGNHDSDGTTSNNQDPLYDKFVHQSAPPATANQGAYGGRTWAMSMGAVKIVTLDQMLNRKTGSTDPGAVQVDDILDEMNTTHPFKILSMVKGIRYMKAAPSTKASGTAAAFADLIPVNYARLFTDASTSLMANPLTNGISGVFWTTQGDHHVLSVYEHAGVQGDVAENYYSICSGTINGSVNFGNDFTAFGTEEGFTFGGSTIKVWRTGHPDDGTPETAAGNDWWGVRYDCYGSRSPKEMEVRIGDKLDDVVWNAKFQSPGGNVPVPI